MVFMVKMVRLSLKIVLILAMLVGSMDQGYALRPMATTVTTDSPDSVAALPNTPGRIEEFLEENSRQMAELYGEEFADSSRWGHDLAARLMLAYIDRDKNDKLWYKKASNIKQVTNESEKKLIVCTCHTGFLAHTGRTLLVAQKLRDLGHEVVFAVDAETKPNKDGKPTQRKYVSLIKEAGFEIYHLPLLAGEDIITHAMQVKGGALGLYNTKMIIEETENMLTILREIEVKKKSPDIILTDLAMVANLPADIMGIPTASLWNFLFTNNNRTNLSPPEKHPVTKLLYRLGGDSLVKLFKKCGMARVTLEILLFSWVIPYNLVRIRYMLKEKRFIRIKRNLYSQVSGDINPSPDYVAFGGMKINDKALPVGPIVWEPKTSIQDEQLVSEFKEFLKRDEENPLIYVTMGSTGMLKSFQLIIKALKDKDYRIVITTGGQFNVSVLGKLPENFFVTPFYLGGEICKEASLMINHGGSGSLNQAMQSRLPQISIPTHPDQQWNSDLVAGAGLGKQILFGNLSVESLSVAVEEILQRNGKGKPEPAWVSPRRKTSKLGTRIILKEPRIKSRNSIRAIEQKILDSQPHQGSPASFIHSRSLLQKMGSSA